MDDQQRIHVEGSGVADWRRFEEAGQLGDGLPTDPPLTSVVEEVLAAVAWDAPPELPAVPPSFRVPTVETVAANAVMAGCPSAALPVVVAALQAMGKPEFNLHGVLATTHPCTPLCVVSGPVRYELGMNVRGNCFGQGNRANATIGRALRLVLTNVGGALPGVMDRATQGNPGKYSWCFGENEEESPFPSLGSRLGFEPGTSSVAVLAAEMPHNVNDHASTRGEGIVTTIAGTMASTGSNNLYLGGPHLVVLGPEHAHTLARDGWTVERLQEALYERSRVDVRRLTSGNRERIAYLGGTEPVDGFFYLGPDPWSLVIAVAGGEGKHSAWIPSFGSTALTTAAVRTTEVTV